MSDVWLLIGVLVFMSLLFTHPVTKVSLLTHWLCRAFLSRRKFDEWTREAADAWSKLAAPKHGYPNFPKHNILTPEGRVPFNRNYMGPGVLAPYLDWTKHAPCDVCKMTGEVKGEVCPNCGGYGDIPA